MSKQIDELGIQLGRSLAEVVKNAIAIVQETIKENPITFSAQANVESVAVTAEEEPKKPAPKKAPARKSTAKKAAPKAEEPKPEPVKEEAPKAEPVKEEAPKAERQVRLVDVAGMGKAIMALGDYHEECMEIMGGKILKDLDPSEYNEVYAKLRDLYHRLKAGNKPETTDPFA